ncbi:MAG: ATP synthase subunit I [Acidimicrobiia bacterium]
MSQADTSVDVTTPGPTTDEKAAALRAELAGQDAPETEIALDMATHALWVAPAVLVVSGLFAGWGGVLGAAAALVLVAVNFLLAAALMRWAARISPEMLAATALGGYVVRLGLITVVGLGLRQVDAVDFLTFGVVLVATHIGLLVWELRSVSLSLAAPGLRPAGE